MMYGSAGGKIAPIYVMHKAQKMYETWVEKSHFNRIDFQCFEDLLLPILKKQVGRKVIIGDNLSSHINIEVVRFTNKIISPLHLYPRMPRTSYSRYIYIAYFRPMKIAWRKVLNTWKENIRNSRYMSVLKEEFPGLLKEFMKEKYKNFRKCAIFPQNRQTPQENGRVTACHQRISRRQLH